MHKQLTFNDGPAFGGASSWRAYQSIIIAIGFCFVGLAAIYFANRGTSLLIGGEVVGVLLAVSLLVLACLRWEMGVQALLVIVIVEGALRKWFVPSYAELVYFYKDALMIAVIVGYLRQPRKAPLLIGHQLKLFQILLTPFVIYAFAMLANASAPHPVVSLFGVKAYCLYMPLAFIIPRMFSTREKLVKFLRWYLVIALGVAALGALQFTNNASDSSINRYIPSEGAGETIQDTAMFVTSEGDYFVRVTSTFSFVSGLTVYLPVVFALLLGLTSLRAARTLPFSVRLIYYLAMGAVVATAFMTGSRGVIVNLGIVAIIFFAFTSMKNAVRRLRQLAVGGVLVLLTVMILAPQAVDGVYERAFGGEEQMDEGSERIEAVFSFPSEEASYAGAFGYGIGATQNSVSALMNKLNLPYIGERIPLAREGEPARMMIEVGVVGFLLFTMIRLGTIVILLRSCLAIRDSEMKALAVAGFAAILFPLVVGGAVVNHTQNVYQWFLIGMVLALLNADKLAQAAPQTEAARTMPPLVAREPFPVPVFERR